MNIYLQIIVIIFVAFIFYKIGAYITRKKWRGDIDRCKKHYEKLLPNFFVIKSVDNGKLYLTLDCQRTWCIVEKTNSSSYKIICKVKKNHTKDWQAIHKQLQREALVRSIIV